MGTHATARINGNGDFIDLHTRWDGFENEGRRYFETLNPLWSGALDLFEKVVQSKDLSIHQIDEWRKNMRSFIDEQRERPTLEGITALFSSMSLSHYAPLTHYADSPLEGYDYDHALSAEIDFELELSNAAQCDQKFKYGRINMDGSFIDFKYSIDETELSAWVLTIPQFWRDFYYSMSGYGEHLNLSEDDQFKMSMAPIFRLHSKLNLFNPNEFDHNPDLLPSFFKPKKSHEAHPAHIQNRLMTVASMVPFDLSASSFLNHVLFRIPGRVLPLTYKEINVSREPDFKIDLSSGRLSSICVSYSGCDIDDLKTAALSLAQSNSDQFSVSSGFQDAEIVFNKTETGVLVEYEASIVILMDKINKENEILNKRKIK